MAEIDDILSRLRKLLALANDDAATPGEAAAAMNRAQRLIDEHRLSAAVVRASLRADGTQQVHGFNHRDVVEREVLRRARLDRWDIWLSRAVALTAGTEAFLVGSRAIVHYGLPADVAVAEELLLWARHKLQGAVRYWARSMRRLGYAVQTNDAHARSFKDGFCRELIDKAAKAREAAGRSREQARVAVAGERAAGEPAASDGPATALVALADLELSRTAALRAYRAAQHPGMTQARGRGGHTHSPVGYDAGRAAGRQVRLNRDALG